MAGGGYMERTTSLHAMHLRPSPTWYLFDADGAMPARLLDDAGRADPTLSGTPHGALASLAKPSTAKPSTWASASCGTWNCSSRSNAGAAEFEVCGRVEAGQRPPEGLGLDADSRRSTLAVCGACRGSWQAPLTAEGDSRPSVEGRGMAAVDKAAAEGRRAGQAGAWPDAKAHPPPGGLPQRCGSRPCSGAVQAPVRAHAKNEEPSCRSCTRRPPCSPSPHRGVPYPQRALGRSTYPFGGVRRAKLFRRVLACRAC